MVDVLLEWVVQILAGGVQVLRWVPTWGLALLAWSIALLALWNVVVAGRETVRRSQTMHQIPCANCQFFTDDYRLKCTVHPDIALTEAAISCQDFESASGLPASLSVHSVNPSARR